MSFLTQIAYGVMTEKAFSNLAILANSEEKAISLWRSIRSWGGDGALEAHFIDSMKTLYPGFVAEVLKGRSRPTHVAALIRRGNELEESVRNQFFNSKQLTIQRALIGEPWIRHVDPKLRQGLIYSKDSVTRTEVVLARFLPVEERLAALSGLDENGVPWYETKDQREPRFEWYRLYAGGTDDLSIKEMVKSEVLEIHTYLWHRQAHRMSQDSRRASVSKVFEILETAARINRENGGSLLGNASGVLNRLMRVASFYPPAAGTHIKEVAKQVQSERSGWRAVSLDEVVARCDFELLNSTVSTITGPAEDQEYQLPKDVIESGSLSQIRDRHRSQPLTVEEAAVLGGRTRRTDHLVLYPSSVAEMMVEEKVSSEVAAAFYRSCVEAGDVRWTHYPAESFVQLMTTSDAVSTLLLPVALELLHPEQLREALGEEKSDLWHEAAAQWPDTLHSLLVITGD